MKTARLFRFSTPREVRALQETGRALRLFLERAIEMTGSDSGSFILLNPNTGMLEIEASIGLSKRASQLKLRLGQGITGWVATTGQPMRIDDVRQERKYVAVSRRVRSELAVPVESKGQVVGVINLDSYEVAHYDQAAQTVMLQLARESAEWLSYGWAVRNMEIKARQLTNLLGMGRRIVAHENWEEALNAITHEAMRLMDVKVCSLMLLSEDEQELKLHASCGTSEHYRNRSGIPVAESLVGVVVRRGKPVTVLDVQVDPRYQQSDLARQEGLVSLLSVPLTFGGRSIGVLNVYTAQPRRFSNDEIALLQTLADMSAVAIEKTRLLARVVETEEGLRRSERLSALGLVATEVAHEIRNPLTVLQMLFQCLVNETPLSPAARKDAEIIEEKMQQMNRIVEQVLSLARTTEPQRELLDVDRMMENLLLLTRHKLGQQGIEVHRHIAPQLPAVHADRTQLEQALLNLILNAADAMPKGGALWLGAELVHRAEGGNVPVPYLALSVRDNGEGMSKEQTERLFAPFLTTKQHGTGIGMAIVQKIVENHHGKITVHSRRQRGTKITLLLPV